MARMAEVGQDSIKDVFGIGQRVLVRRGKSWVPKIIEAITVIRHDDGAVGPRFWFSDYGNVPISEVIAKVDIEEGP